MKKTIKILFVSLLLITGLYAYGAEKVICLQTNKKIIAFEGPAESFTVKTYNITRQHLFIEAGYLYRLKDTTLNLPQDSTTGFAFLTPTSEDASYLHITFETDGAGESTILIYEGITGDVGDEITSIYYLNRNSTRTRNTTFYEIGSAVGTLLIDPEVYGAQKKTGGGGFGEEIVCLPNTYYLFLIRADASNLDYTYKALAYEFP